MNQSVTRADTPWRKSRLAARLLLRRESGALCPRDRALARGLADDPEVSDRLIQQALYFLGIGPRKNEFDTKLFELEGKQAQKTSNLAEMRGKNDKKRDGAN